MLSADTQALNNSLNDDSAQDFPAFSKVFEVREDSVADAALTDSRGVIRSIIPGEFVLGIQQGADWLQTINSFSSNLASSVEGLTSLTTDEILSLVGSNEESIEIVHVSFDGSTALSDLLASATKLDHVLWAAPNYLYTGDILDFSPNDPLFSSQYHHALMGNTAAWDVTLGDPSVLIAITDDGVQLNHPDLAANIWQNSAEVGGVAGVDDDGNGFIDDFNGWDFVGGDNDPSPVVVDDNHGTHVAGIAAGVTNNGNQISGTAGGATIMPIRIAGFDGGFSSSIMASAFAYAIDNGARIANTSYNIDGFVGDPTFTAGLQYYYDNGGLHFNSAGNGNELNPARQSFHQTLLVANTNSSDVRSSSSNYGAGVDIAAPGSGILSTVTSSGTATFSGTSMAAPNAAGAAALIWSANPGFTRDQVAAQLLGTADGIDGLNPGFEGLLGAGRVNSSRALSETLPPPEISLLLGLPADGSASGGASRFEISFDQVMDPASVDVSHFDLRSAGANATFGDLDDVVYNLSHADYMIGTNSLVVEITDGPLGLGMHRFTATSGGLQNPFGAPLDGDGDGVGGDDFVLSFTIVPTVTVDTLYTNDSTPELTGTVDDPNATILVDVGGQIGLVAVNNGDGTWTLPDNSLSPLPDGVYDVKVSATDTASNVGVDSTAGELTIDSSLIGLLFAEYFPSTTFDASNWSLFDATIDSVGIGEPTEPNAARLNGTPNGGDLMQSVVFDLSGIAAHSSVELRYFFQQTGGGESPDSGDDLIVEYRDPSSNWVELERQLGSGPDMSTFQQSILTLPAIALHANSQFRFRNQATNGAFDDWFVDDIELLQFVDDIPPIVTVDILFTNDTTPALTGTVDDPAATILVEVNGQTGLPAVNNGDGTWTLPDNTLAALNDGVYEVVVTATDPLANVGVDATANELTIDNVAPTVTVDALLAFDSTPELTGSVDDPTATVLVDVGGQSGVAAINNGDGTWTLPNNTLAPLPDGTYDVVATAIDLASNTAQDGTTDELTINAGALATIYSADMNVDPGWLFSDVGANKWAWGTPTGGGSFNGDPTSGFTGANVIGYNLAGDYPDLMNEEYATTPPIDTRGFENVTLSFRRWLGIESASFDHAQVQVTNDGVNWTTVWDHTGGSFSESGWSLQEYDISAVADNQQTVQVRWVMGDTDGSVTYPGWNIDDVIVQGIGTTTLGEIHGAKWNDLDGDGVRDPGEPGLQGWTIYLDINGNGQLDAGGTTTIEPDDFAAGTILNTVDPAVTLSAIGASTDNVVAATSNFSSTGSQVFANDSADNWYGSRRLRADFAAPTNAVSIVAISDDSSDFATLEAYDAAGNLLDTYNTAQLGAGAVETMTITRVAADIAYVIASGVSSDVVYLDNLRFGQGFSEPTAVTDANGDYWFTGLAAGNYLVGEVQQPGWVQTFPGGASGGGVLLISDTNELTGVEPFLSGDGHSVTTITGEYAAGSPNLQDLAFLSSFEMVIWGASGGGAGVVHTPAVHSTLESYIQAGGHLLVTGYDTLASPADPGLAALVRSTTTADIGENSFTTSTLDHFVLNGPAGDLRGVTITPGYGDWDGATADSAAGAISLATFDSANFDAIIYTDVPGVGGSVGYWTGGDSGSQATDGKTDWKTPGDSLDILRNWVFGSISGSFIRVTLAPGQVATGVDFGNQQLGSGEIHGTKWNDLDGNGVRDAGEPGLEGWTIYLDLNGNGQLDEVSQTVTIEPDDHAAGALLNMVDPAVTLTAIGASSSNVYADVPGGGFASTGSLGFTSDSGATWSGTRRLRADFSAPTDTVSIDAISDDSSDFATLEAYDSSGTLLETYDTASLGTGVIETMTISRGATDIAYVIASGVGGDIVNLDNLRFGQSSSEPTAVTDANGDYWFTGLPPGDYLVAEVQQPGWVQTSPTEAGIAIALDQLNANSSAISALVPSRYDFVGGETGTSISDGGNDMYDGGNFLNTNLASSIPYTNGVLTASDGAFGVGSQYFTAKYPGLFALAASGVAIDEFEIRGNNGADGGGSVDGDVLSTVVKGREFTIFVKRVYGAGDPSINHIIMVPGDGAGITHSFPPDTNNDLHTVTGLSSVDEIYYALVARQNGARLENVDVLNIANEFLANVALTSGVHQVTLAPDEILTGIDFGNQQIGVAEIHGTKWNDLNGDGLRDVGEPGLAGWTIYLDLNENGQLDGSASGIVEPDDYGAGTLLNTVDPAVTLSAIGASSANVSAGVPSGGYTSTGSLAFISDSGTTWSTTRRLRVDFSAPTDSVSIDAISDDLSDVATLEAYDSAGLLLQAYNTASLGTGAVETMTITRGAADIAYVIASGVGGDIVNLDNLRFGQGFSEPTAVTDANGDYWFTDLAPGDYVVAEVQQPGWVQTSPAATAPVLITELNVHSPDFLEIQNVSGRQIDTTGWQVVISDSPYTDINAVNSTTWTLPPLMSAGEVLYRTDSSTDNYWGSNIFWAAGPGTFTGWAMILDASGDIVDWVGWGWSDAELANFNVTVGGLTIAGLNDEWTGPAIGNVDTTGTGAGTLQRIGAGDSNSDTDFIWSSATSKGAANDGLSLLGGPWNISLAPNEVLLGVDFGNRLLLPGDYNFDGVVDAADYTVYRDTLGSIVQPYSGADGDGDGSVDRDDYLVWRSNYGIALPVPPALPAFQPESSVTLTSTAVQDVDIAAAGVNQTRLAGSTGSVRQTSTPPHADSSEQASSNPAEQVDRNAASVSSLSEIAKDVAFAGYWQTTGQSTVSHPAARRLAEPATIQTDAQELLLWHALRAQRLPHVDGIPLAHSSNRAEAPANEIADAWDAWGLPEGTEVAGPAKLVRKQSQA